MKNVQMAVEGNILTIKSKGSPPKATGLVPDDPSGMAAPGKLGGWRWC